MPRSFRWLLLTLSLVTGLVLASAAELKIRPNVTTLTAQQRTNFCRCVLWLKTHPSQYDATSSGLNAYDWLVRLHKAGFESHLTGGSGVHMAPSFFPWHREYLRAFERELARAAQDLGITTPVLVPYWDWTDPASAEAVFRADFMGSNGGGTPSAFTSGPQATRSSPFRVRDGFFGTQDDRTSEFPINTSTNVSGNSAAGPPRFFLQRAIATHQIFGGGSPGTVPAAFPTPEQLLLLPTPEEVLIGLRMSVYDQPGWDNIVETNITYTNRITFRNYMEGHTGLFSIVDEPFGDQMHGRVHLWVSGNLGASSSPNDPLFWLHHANLDRLWAEWQDRHGLFNFPADWFYLNAAEQAVGVAATDWLWSFSLASNYVANVSSLDTLDLRTSGIRYDTQPVTAPTSIQAQISGSPNPGSVVLTIPALSGLRYQLQRSDALGGNWANQGPAVVAKGNTVTFTELTDPDARFYRVLVTAEGNQPLMLSESDKSAWRRQQADPVCGVALTQSEGARLRPR